MTRWIKNTSVGYEFISLKDHVALVTGATGTIGKATVELLSAAGASVVIHYNSSEREAAELVSIVTSNGGVAVSYQADFSNSDEIAALFVFIKQYFGKLDILVNNAAIMHKNHMRAVTVNEWNAIMEINLKGSYFCAKEAAKIMMKKQGGSIVNISSLAALRPGFCESVYDISKGGLLAMTKALAKELGDYHIRVNAVLPGPVNSHMNPLMDETIAYLNKMLPLHIICSPVDVAQTILFLCSHMSGCITGEAIRVDSGFYLI